VKHRSSVFLVLLRSTIACRVVHSAKSGPKPYFTVQGLFGCSKKGYVKTRRVLKIVNVIAMKRMNGCISYGCGGSFQLTFCIKSTNCTATRWLLLIGAGKNSSRARYVPSPTQQLTANLETSAALAYWCEAYQF